MKSENLCWAVFVAVLCPLVLATPVQPLAVTLGHIALCLVLVAFADRRERS